MERLCKELLTNGIPFVRDCPLVKYNTLRMKGCASLAIFPDTKEQLIRSLSLACEYGVSHAVVGKGSNLLFPSDRYEGALIFTTSCKRISFEGNRAMAEAGAPLVSLAIGCRNRNLGGAEFAAGIPGTVGGAVLMNAGAFGGEMSQIVRRTEYWDEQTATEKILVGEEHVFGKRESFFSERPSLTILSVEMEFSTAQKDEIDKKMAEFHDRRAHTQPLEFPNAGSIFKHPEGMFAGKIIDELGLKGARVGDAEVSTKHAGFIVNRGSATDADILELIELIRERVRREIGVELECELRRLDGKKI
jgi:UDP-N-acetylmuramate dehydrogenase